MSEATILEKSEALIITKGENGSSILQRDSQIDVKAVEPTRIADPTGVGDAYRGGFMKGLAIGADYRTCAQLGSVAATYALEHLGGSSHAFSRAEFSERYARHFGPVTMTL
jgi:adenosine kinase